MRVSPGSRTRLPNLWLPKSYQDLNSLPTTNIIYEHEISKVVSPSPGVIIKYGGDLAEEVRAIHFAQDKFSFTVSKILYHPPLHRGRFSDDVPSGTSPFGVWYICMELCPGISLDKVIDTMTTVELDHVAEQLKSILAQMASFRPKTLGSVTGGPYRNFFFPSHVGPKYAFTSVGEFIDQYRQMFMLFCTETFTESLLSRLPRNSAICFGHGDLLPKNIMVKGSDITGIIDWATAGFYPEFWEYCRMHDPFHIMMNPSWDHVLRRIFPTPRRQMEIDCVRQLLNIVSVSF